MKPQVPGNPALRGAPPPLAPDPDSRPVAEQLADRPAYFQHQGPCPLIRGNGSRAPKIVLNISCARASGTRHLWLCLFS